MAVRQPVRVGLVEMLEKRIRIQDPEHVARRDTRLETALASFSHLLNLEACRFGFAGELVHRLELSHNALEPLVLVGSWAASPVAALNLDEHANGRRRLRQHRQQLRCESRRGPLPFGHGREPACSLPGELYLYCLRNLLGTSGYVVFTRVLLE